MINKGHDNGANKKQLPKLNVHHNDLPPKRDHWMFKWRKIIVVNIGCLNAPMKIQGIMIIDDQTKYLLNFVKHILMFGGRLNMNQFFGQPR